MATEGIDYSDWRPSAWNDPTWWFAARYLSSPGNAKNLTLAESQALTAAGKSIIVVFETTGTDFGGGRAQGQADARTALNQAFACGKPTGRPIYFAIDQGTTDFAAVDLYLDGCADVLGHERVGVYGSYAVVEHTMSSGSAAWWWQTFAWSAGQVCQGIHLYQYENGPSFDLDRTSLADFGQWRIGWSPTPAPAAAVAAAVAPAPDVTQPPTKIPGDELMNVEFSTTTGGDGTAYVEVTIPAGCTRILGGWVDVESPVVFHPPHHDGDIRAEFGSGVVCQPAVGDGQLPPGHQTLRISGAMANHYYTGRAICG